MSQENKDKYHTSKVRDHRSKNAPSAVATPTQNQAETENNEPSATKNGRRPVNDTPMTPNTRKKRKIETTQTSEETENKRSLEYDLEKSLAET